MQYEQTNEKVTVMDGLPVAVTGPLSLTEDPQIQRFRKYLLILLGVFLFWNTGRLQILDNRFTGEVNFDQSNFIG
ncbi:unnamed protein product [Rotaria socialis]